ncbi:hypothetical protein DCCM_4450 [Desulfocucumis palustris]|uniref:DUF2905 domain-containing protein n=1 Tax=Desulfocucumis palustris TaxID=1898651 RepID=A0A2L2XG67_9FIRM|nr:DUF2905 domain-containing protein [Desulfocucumis palustris]GBF35327.1 hypothetical protein DCCM_4450 [Desulfocucumis palustris]
MDSLNGIGKIIVIMGIILVVTGLLLMFSGKIFNFGKLPGDILIRKGNFTFYFPLVSMILLSILLTVILNLFFRR